MGVPERRRGKGTKRIFEEIIVKIFPNLMKKRIYTPKKFDEVKKEDKLIFRYTIIETVESQRWRLLKTTRKKAMSYVRTPQKIRN